MKILRWSPVMMVTMDRGHYIEVHYRQVGLYLTMSNRKVAMKERSPIADCSVGKKISVSSDILSDEKLPHV